jgi:hypothetical protein
MALCRERGTGSGLRQPGWQHGGLASANDWMSAEVLGSASPLGDRRHRRIRVIGSVSPSAPPAPALDEVEA